MLRRGDRVGWRGQTWIITAPLPSPAGRCWRVMRRNGRTWLAGFAAEASLTLLERPSWDVGESVTVGSDRKRGTVAAIEGNAERPVYVVELPAEVRTSPGGNRWQNDARVIRAAAELIDI